MKSLGSELNFRGIFAYIDLIHNNIVNEVQIYTSHTRFNVQRAVFPSVN